MTESLAASEPWRRHECILQRTGVHGTLNAHSVDERPRLCSRFFHDVWTKVRNQEGLRKQLFVSNKRKKSLSFSRWHHFVHKSLAVTEMGDSLASIDMGRKVCVCGGVLYPFPWDNLAPSNTISPGPRPISVPSGILIHPAIWPQSRYRRTGQTGQTGQTIWSDSIGRTLLQTVTHVDEIRVNRQ